VRILGIDYGRKRTGMALSDELGITGEELQRWQIAWGKYLIPTLQDMSRQRKHFRIRQLAGSLADYRRCWLSRSELRFLRHRQRRR